MCVYGMHIRIIKYIVSCEVGSRRRKIMIEIACLEIIGFLADWGPRPVDHHRDQTFYIYESWNFDHSMSARYYRSDNRCNFSKRNATKINRKRRKFHPLTVNTRADPSKPTDLTLHDFVYISPFLLLNLTLKRIPPFKLSKYTPIILLVIIHSYEINHQIERCIQTSYQKWKFEKFHPFSIISLNICCQK